MKLKDVFITAISGVFVVFLLLLFFYHTGESYGFSEDDNIGNISIHDFEDTINSAEETATTMESIFNSKSITITTFNLIVRGLPSAGKTFYRTVIDSMKLLLIGTKKIFSTHAITILIGVITTIVMVILIIMLWDWIRGIKPGG